MASSSPMYRLLAEHYDLEYEAKDYRGETAQLVRTARKFGSPGGDRWLDVACGTGRHLAFLRRRYRVTGVDVSPEMLREARRRLPGVRLVHRDMRDFELGERFDVVSCLFSAVGYLRTEAALREALATFARHLRPGGVLLVEPWIEPAQVKPSHISLTIHDGGTVKIARASYLEVRGALSYVHFDHMILEKGRGIRHVRETEVLRLTPRRRLVEIARAVGLDARMIRRGPTDERGLLVGVAPGKR